MVAFFRSGDQDGSASNSIPQGNKNCPNISWINKSTFIKISMIYWDNSYRLVECYYFEISDLCTANPCTRWSIMMDPGPLG